MLLQLYTEHETFMPEDKHYTYIDISDAFMSEQLGNVSVLPNKYKQMSLWEPT